MFQIQENNSKLHIFKGDNIKVLKSIINNINIENIIFNMDYTPYALKRDKEIENYASNVNMDIDTFKQVFITNEIDFSLVIERIETDLLWSSLIFSIYKSRLSVNLEEINDQLSSFNQKKKIEEYLISEIIHNPVEKDKIKNTVEKQKEEIKNKGFENVALEKSISNTAVKGGNLGWIDENSISGDLKSRIINTKVGEVSEPFFLPKGILFFKRFIVTGIKFKYQFWFNSFASFTHRPSNLVCLEQFKK